MAKEYPLGHLAGLRLSANPSALAAALVLWLILAFIAVAILHLPPIEAVVGGFLAVILHFVSEFLHHLGHAWAARRTGYPMTGVRFWFLFAMSLYPPDEGELPASVHIRRALGGAPASLLVTLLTGVIVLALRPLEGSLLWWLAIFLFLDNLLVFTLGAFLPLSFTDGSTLLKWWGK
jgi:hypothetical protein